VRRAGCILRPYLCILFMLTLVLYPKTAFIFVFPCLILNVVCSYFVRAGLRAVCSLHAEQPFLTAEVLQSALASLVRRTTSLALCFCCLTI
jgi:hypothetical protein